MTRTLYASIFCLLHLLIVGSLVKAEPPVAEDAAPDEPQWLTDYTEAIELAKLQHKMLFIFFHETGASPARDTFEARSLADATVRERLANYVCAKLPLAATTTEAGQEITVLDHAAFSEMKHRQGVAIIDMAHLDAKYYGYVVNSFPFRPGWYYNPEPTAAMLELPPGTMTQRTMVFAVRVHPEHPASTNGEESTMLLNEAESHSSHQAAIRIQGHHQWESRFHRISAQLPAGELAQEIVAESNPGDDLVDAAIECVRCWRQSPGHWSAVRGDHPLFGYDIRRGGNGVWYATGIFGNRR